MARRVLTVQDVEDIRVRIASGEATQASIARGHGISRSQVSRIVSGKTWKGSSNTELKARLAKLEAAGRKLDGYFIHRRIGDGGENVSIHMENFAELRDLLGLKPWRP